MPLVTYIEANGEQYEVDVEAGSTIMQGAVDNMIDGILAECGGACACATCHCYIDPAWWEKVGKPNDMEQEMLESVVEPQPTSRLGCQVEITSDMDGLIVRLPTSQY